MSVLIIDDKAKELIKQVKEYAEANPFDADIDIPLDRNTCQLDHGYIALYTIDPSDVKPGTYFRHLSIIVERSAKLPSPWLVETLIKEFGFENDMLNCVISKDDMGNKHHSVDIYEPYTKHLTHDKREAENESGE